MSLKYEVIVNGPFQENCYLVWDDASKQAVFIDPGDEPQRLAEAASSRGLEVVGIFNTHGHIDHAGAVVEVQKRFDVPFAMHPDDAVLLDSMPEQAALFGLPRMEIPTVDRRLSDGELFNVGEHTGKVIHTPGHSPGGVCFAFEDFVFVGDTLFAGSIGRTDLPGGSYETLIDSIKSKLLVLRAELPALPGHGPATTIGLEKERNPFLTNRIWT